MHVVRIGEHQDELWEDVGVLPIGDHPQVIRARQDSVLIVSYDVAIGGEWGLFEQEEDLIDVVDSLCLIYIGTN